MPKVCNEIFSVTFEPNALRMLAGIFDDVWAGVASEFGTDPDAVEAGRIRLATIILNLGRDGQLGRDQVTRTASRLIRQASRTH
jgi:hypothetical protein